MKELYTIASKEEFKAYLLIYCANADYTITQIETDYIKSKVKVDNFDFIYNEMYRSNDYQCIQNILMFVKKYNYSKNEKENLFREIKELFKSDGKFNMIEKTLYRGLRHLLSNTNYS